MAIAAGLNTSYALTSSGTVYAWGYGTDGELGNGGTSNSDTPVSVSGLSNITAIAGGGDHGLALSSSGTVSAWGLNTSGQLGNGTTTSSDTPVSVSGLSNVTAVSAAQDSSYARSSTGVVYSWGLNNDGQLGNGTTTDADTAGSISGVTVSAFSASPAGQATFVEQADGSVYGWGSNAAGQLGNNGTTNALSPGPVLTAQNRLASGQSHSLAVRADGSVWTWGANADGQLGNGTTTSSETPIEVSVSPGCRRSPPARTRATPSRPPVRSTPGATEETAS